MSNVKQGTAYLPVGTVTFLLTDVEGSTFLWESAPDAMGAAIRRHYQLLDAAIALHGGVRPEEQGEGDSVVAAFACAPAALAAALDVQRAFGGERWPEGAALKLRIALHTAQAQLRDEVNYFGPAVNRCARLRAVAHGGQVVLSRTTRDLVCDQLPDGAELADLGVHRLRDLGQPEHVYGLAHPDLPAEFPPLRSLGTLSTNLPAELTSFIGRSTELAELSELLGQVRLLTITGAGGCGKTRLARHAAAASLGGHLDGVWWVELAQLEDAAFVPAAVIAAIGVRELPGQGPLGTLVAYLRARRALLILDNCEHLPGACAQLAEALLRGCPSLTVLATSRAPLGVPGETAWRVPSMSLPADARRAYREPVEVLWRSDAVRLFVDRATQVRPDFQLTPANAPAIAQICAELDGIPLAIELAAAQVRVLASAQIAHRLGDRFQLLAGGSRAAVPRQRTLQASIDWSYELLSEGERTLLRRLSVFTGGWTLDAAEQVCGGTGVGGIDGAVAQLLTGLVGKSLVTVAEPGAEHDAEVRYGLLETVRQYGAARLAEAGELDAMGERHFAYYVDLAERAEPAVLRAGKDDPILRRLATELPNLRAALERAAAIDPDAAVKRFDLLLALGDAQWWAGHVSEASATFQAATSLARQFHNPDRLAEAALRVGEVGYGGAYMEAWSYDPIKVEILGEALAALGDQQTLLKARVLARLATALYLSPFDSLARRDSLSRASVQLARRLGDGPTLAYALHARHLAVWGPDNVDERVALSTEIIGLARQAGDVTLEITGHVWRMADLFEIGDVPGADREVDIHEELAQRVGYPHFIAHSLMFRATQAMLRGEFADAEAFAQRSLEFGEQVGDVNVRTSHHVQVALLRALQGRPEESAAYFEPAGREHPPELARLVHMGFACLAGDRTGSKEAFPLIWRARDRIPPPFWLAMMGTCIALVAAYAGAAQEGAAIYDLLRRYEDRWTSAGRDAVAAGGPIAYYLGVLAAALSRFDAAARHFEVALEASDRVGSRPYLALTQGAYGAMLARRGATLDRQRAKRLLADALQAAQQLGMNQLYDDVVAARACLPADPDWLDPQRDLLADAAAVFRREGEYWTIGFQRIVIRLKDTKGLHYLQKMLTDPGRQFHVADLAAGTNSPPRRARDNVGKSLRACLRRIEQAHPALGAHLAAAVRTGYLCSYQPDPGTRVGWRT
ncbi:MAG TPA: adenylate/guanylate cyclase domain-containing protein [Pseudonocardiaceae bacterium]|nr:adenylate/guanylate cyclase domain-containing protein [Pseudonocardiaceae bacterium]